MTYHPTVNRFALLRLKANEDALASLGATVGGITIPRAAQVAAAGPYTVQTGGANPLTGINTANLPAGTLVGVSDLGGCGPLGVPGYGLAQWVGTEWRRISRGVQTTYAPVATMTLDYWKDPTRIILSGTTLVATRILLDNAKLGHLVSLAKPGLSNLLQALAINLTGNSAGTDLTQVGGAVSVYEVLSGSQLSSVST